MMAARSAFAFGPKRVEPAPQIVRRPSGNFRFGLGRCELGLDLSGFGEPARVVVFFGGHRLFRRLELLSGAL